MPLIPSDLAHFTGSETLYRHPMSGMLYTDGVQHVAEEGGAYWLLDLICIAQVLPRLSREPFQVWTLTVSRDAGKVVCTDGDKGDGPVTLYAQAIPYTDFPLDRITFWVEGGVVMLPSER